MDFSKLCVFFGLAAMLHAAYSATQRKINLNGCYMCDPCYKRGNCVIYFIELNDLLMTNIIILLDYTEYCLVKFGKILSSVEKLTLSTG